MHQKISRRAGLLSLFLLATTCFAGAEEPPAKHPAPNRFAKEIAAFATLDEKTPPTKGGIVFTGSSSIRMWKTKSSFPKLPVLNRGFGGSVVNDLTAYVDETVLRYEPKILVIFSGSNDIKLKLGAAQVLKDFQTYLTLVHEKLPQTKIVVNAIRSGPVRIPDQPAANEVNEKLKSWSADKPWIRWVDVPATMEDAESKPLEELYIKDRLHLNKKGYELWTAALLPVLNEEWAKVAGNTPEEKEPK